MSKRTPTATSQVFESPSEIQEFIGYFPENHRLTLKKQHKNMTLAETRPSSATLCDGDRNVCFGKTKNPKILPFDKFFILSYRSFHWPFTIMRELQWDDW